jgi:hypothetical protein
MRWGRSDLRASKMGKAADLVEQAVHETLTYCKRRSSPTFRLKC